MYFILDATTDAAWNLAAEEYLLTRRSESFFRLWQNADSVIIGRNQNTWAEIDAGFVERNHIPVVRRMTGGGAVFHDMGNVNYSFFDLKDRIFTDIVLEALREIGIDARCEGRNDLTVNGLKFSGTAVCKKGTRVLEHGTLLFNSSVERLAAALRPRPEKFSGKAVRSVSKRVTNLSEHLPAPMDIRSFISAIAKHIAGSLGCVAYEYTPDDIAAISRLRDERFGNPDWNFGASPSCSFSNVKKFPAGLMEAHFNVNGGKIGGLKIYGDYFFSKPTEEFAALLEACPYVKEEIADRLSQVTVDEYFSGISAGQILSLLF